MKEYRFEALRMARAEEGSALVITMLLLLVLTIIGVAATNTSIIEILTANANKRKQAAFYAAEAGIQHGKKVLAKMVDDQNTNPNGNAGKTVQSWSFLFDAASTLSDVAGPVHPGEKYLLNDVAFGDHHYTVTVFDNPSSTDGIVFLRSIVNGPGTGFGGVEVSLQAQYPPVNPAKPVNNYNAQQNFGPEKTSKGDDIDDIGAGDLAQTQMNQGV